MHARFDHADKTILGRALSRVGDFRREHEIAPDAQRIDTSFEPAPGREARRATMGLLGRVAGERCLFEIFHDTFGIHTFDGCVRKQLALAHADALAAKKARRRRPPKRRLWILSAGRPASVLRGYELRPMPACPRGFYEGAPAAGTSLIVLRELPRGRDTLFLRLFGSGKVRDLALEDLAALPPGAWERIAADQELVALRLRILETTTNERERRFLMATQDLYEQWKQRMRQEGRQQGRQEGRQQGRQEGRQEGLQEGGREARRQALLAAYEARFGTVPADLRAAIEEAGASPEAFSHWIALVATRPQQEIAAALRPAPEGQKPKQRSRGPASGNRSRAPR